jgi:hypothetical protein
MRTRLFARFGALAFALALSGALPLAGCSQQRAARQECPEIPEGLPVTELEMSYLAMLRASHKSADIWEDRGDLEKALSEIKEALSVERPPGLPSEEAYLDAAGRAGQLLLKLKRPDDALALAEAAAKTASGDTFYLAALKMVEGEAREARAALQRDKDPEAATREDAAALDAYEASQAINRRVLEALKAGRGQ